MRPEREYKGLLLRVGMLSSVPEERIVAYVGSERRLSSTDVAFSRPDN